MSNPWVDAAKTALRLQTEATVSATRLGHRMSSWVVAPGDMRLFLSRCINCDDVARVSVRDPNRAPITGAAVELRCVPRKRVAAKTAPALPPAPER